MPAFQWIAMLGLGLAALGMLLVTQSKERVSWPAWLVPAVILVPFAGLAVFALRSQGLPALWETYTGSWWGLLAWFDRLVGVAVAFFLIQNRARAAGLKSEVWVLLVICTGSLGLLLMLAMTLYWERRRAREDEGSPSR
jgi:hypothetical protein